MLPLLLLLPVTVPAPVPVPVSVPVPVPGAQAVTVLAPLGPGASGPQLGRVCPGGLAGQPRGALLVTAVAAAAAGQAVPLGLAAATLALGAAGVAVCLAVPRALGAPVCRVLALQPVWASAWGLPGWHQLL